MSVNNDILTVGFDKNGEADFGVRCSVYDLSYEQMKDLRAMITVAIGVMEQMWRDNNLKKPENRACEDATMPRKDAQSNGQK